MPPLNRRATAALLILPAALIGASAHSIPQVERLEDPLSFFEGRTEMVSTVKVMMKKPYRSRTLGRGQIHPDGSLSLVQQIEDKADPVKQRRWRMRKVGPARFAGTMTDAVGPVTAEEIDGRYRFRFKTKSNLSVEQWVTPLPGGSAAKSEATIKKFGMRVATSSGTIRKL